MKRNSVRILSLLICTVLLLCACSKAPDMKYENGTYIHPVHGTVYTYAPEYYEPITYEKDSVVANLPQAGDLSVYPITGISEKKMLCTEYYDVLCANGVTLPELLKDFNPNKLLICKTIELTAALATVTSKTEVDAIVALFQNGNGFSISEMDSSIGKERYDLKFESANYAGVYYSFTYWKLEEPVLVYEVISDPNDFELSYSGVAVNTEEYKGEYYAVYNFGTEILYDRANELCYYAGDMIGNYLGFGTSEGET